ncbi:MAG: amidohydrolase family protein [Desulfuromonadales bacterium]|nr:amidohydrolase family protein [Desulfuromonadales bacterium]
MRKKMFNIVVMALFVCCFSLSAIAQAETTLFKNVKVFNGSDDKLLDADVLVEGNMIKQVGKNLSAEGATVIDGDGRTLMPGLIEAHTHLIGGAFTADVLIRPYWDEIAVKMLVRAQDYFDMGFTTVRDAGSWSLGIKAAIDQGVAAGPRVLSSGAGISQTGGHGDLRLPYQNNPYFSPASAQPERSNLNFLGAMHLADGVPEVRRAARSNLAAGAHFIKVLGGGGIYSMLDPLESLQYSDAELKAAAEEASNYGTYAAIHAHLDEAVSRAIDLGFKLIEHATVMEEGTVKKMADNDVVWGLQTSLFLADPATNPAASSPIQRKKAQRVHDGLRRTIEYAKKYDVKTLWGTDIIGSREAFFKLFPGEWEYRNEYYTPFEQLQQVTKINGEAIAMSGIRNPYPAGPLGVIEEGAYADILLVKGNPLENVLILRDYKENIDLIMKDGKVYKNSLNP